jgi:hypothetical protein
VRGYPAIRVVFTEAEGTRFIRRTVTNASLADENERPVLLRGIGTMRHNKLHGKRGEIPVAGTIYQEDGALLLEVSAHHLNHRAPHRIVVARAFLGNLTLGGIIRGRAAHPSSFAFQNLSCGSDDKKADMSSVPDQVAQQGASQKSSETKIIYMGTDFDAEFMKVAKCKTPAQCNNRIVSMVNQSSLTYAKQLGIKLKVVRQGGPTAFSAGTQDSSKIYEDYGNYVWANYRDFLHDGLNSGPTLVDHYTGFTGKKMRAGIVGLATLGSLCENFRTASSNMIVRHISDILTPFIISHELGHNLSARHSNAGIMAPKLSRAQKKPLRFTSDSTYQISSHADAWYHECLEGARWAPPPEGPKVEMLVESKPALNFSLSYSISNWKSDCQLRVRAAESEADINSGVVVYEPPPDVSGGGYSVNITTAVDVSAAADATVYLKGFYVCPGEQVSATSQVVSYLPRYGQSYDSRVPRAEWIEVLRRKLMP